MPFKTSNLSTYHKQPNKMKTAKAETHLAIWVHCPYCDSYQNKFYDLRECLGSYGGDFLRAEDCEQEIECEDCEKTFIVNEITY